MTTRSHREQHASTAHNTIPTHSDTHTSELHANISHQSSSLTTLKPKSTQPNIT